MSRRRLNSCRLLRFGCGRRGVPGRRTLRAGARRLVWIAAWLLVSAPSPAADGPYMLKEANSESRIEAVEIRVSVAGTAEFAVEKGKSLTHPITADAVLKYRERRLQGAGRDAQALRALRRYDALQADIKVGGQLTSSRLSDDRRLIVAQGRREGIFFYSPDGLLTASQLDLLRAPGDSLCLLALLPPGAVDVGAKWSPPSWVAQMLTDTEAASKQDLVCSLDSVADGLAKINFSGTIEGATAGSSGSVRLQGWLLFDLAAQRITRAEIEQGEQRSISPVSPGMKVTARAVLVRGGSDDANGLTAEMASAVPLEPPASLTPLVFRAFANVELEHDRGWRLFQQSPQVAVLRLIDQGTFVAQCNVAPVLHAAPGEHVPEQKFQDDVRASLGARLKSIEKAEPIPSQPGRFVYRVIARGDSTNGPITWIYYLCAAPDGAQVSFVFAVDTSLRPRLGDRDLQMIKSLRFLEPPKEPEKAAPKKPDTP